MSSGVFPFLVIAPSLGWFRVIFLIRFPVSGVVLVCGYLEFIYYCHISLSIKVNTFMNIRYKTSFPGLFLMQNYFPHLVLMLMAWYLSPS